MDSVNLGWIPYYQEMARSLARYKNDRRELVDRLKSLSVTVYAAHLNGTADYREVTYGDRIAFLIGNEGNGLKDETAALADEYIKIPMAGKVESLNAAVAASILMYEYGRSMRC